MSKFNLAVDIQEQNINTIILLGGASGTGKSSISSALASHLGLPEVLSTDSIRHILRNFINKSDAPVLFVSTYETHLAVPDSELDPQINTASKILKYKLIKGYLQQSEIVQSKLEYIIDDYILKKQSLVIEGVHLTSEFMFRIWQKYHKQSIILPFLVVINKSNVH